VPCTAVTQRRRRSSAVNLLVGRSIRHGSSFGTGTVLYCTCTSESFVTRTGVVVCLVRMCSTYIVYVPVVIIPANVLSASTLPT